MSKTSGKRAKRIALASLGAAVFVSIVATSNLAALWAKPSEAESAAPWPRAAAKSTARPNFVVILTDDMDAASFKRVNDGVKAELEARGLKPEPETELSWRVRDPDGWLGMPHGEIIARVSTSSTNG